MMVRVIHWDDTTLPFGNSPSKSIPDADQLRADVESGTEWHWYYKGLCGVIPMERMRNAIQSWDAVQMQRHRRNPVPVSVGVFGWEDVEPLEKFGELGETDTCTHPGSRRKANQRPA